MNSGEILITGAKGFIGSMLMPQLRAEGYSVDPAELDLLDFSSVTGAIEKKPWNTLIHLAGMSHVPTCEKDPGLAYRTNLNGTIFLLDALHRSSPHTHFIFMSTAQVYAAPEESELNLQLVFDENRRILPQNLYAFTKWRSELILKDAAEKLGMKITILRLFNHTHRTQSPDFFLPHLYSQLSKATKGTEISIPVGNLNLSRDIGSVKDLLSAIIKVTKRGSTGFDIFNVCSGTPKNLKLLADGLAERLHVPAKFIVDPARIRPGEPLRICGSHQKLSQATGWQPQCHTEADLLEEFLSEA